MIKKRRLGKSGAKKTGVKTVKLSSAKKDNKVKEPFYFTLNTIAEYIRTRAYYIWEDLGKPQGKDNDIWNKAEKDILSKIIKKGS